MVIKNLKKIAVDVTSIKKINDYVQVGSVGAAIATHTGNIYTGISIDTSCSLGFCAEHAAVAEMLKHGEYKIKAMVAVDSSGNAIPPCGRCRELISQLSKENLKTIVEVENDTFIFLQELLPYDWKRNQRRDW